VASAGLHRDLEHLGRELIDVDRLDEHPRRVRFTHPQQEPGALGDEIHRMRIAGRLNARNERPAKQDGHPARGKRRIEPTHQRRQEQPVGTAECIGIEAPFSRADDAHEIRRPPREIRYLDRRLHLDRRQGFEILAR
jgi:hypothetical protein